VNLLEVRGIETGYGASQVLFGVSFSIAAGEVATLLGRNGMGKTTTIRALFGLLRLRRGEIGANRSASAAPWTLERVFDFFPRLATRAEHMGHQLSGGEQQMLAIGRALMTNPRLLILDEATEGLAPLVREDIWKCLAALKTAGQTILVIDKYIKRLVALADVHTILERGRVVWQGNSAALAADRSLWHRFLGV